MISLTADGVHDGGKKGRGGGTTAESRQARDERTEHGLSLLMALEYLYET